MDYTMEKLPVNLQAWILQQRKIQEEKEKSFLEDTKNMIIKFNLKISLITKIGRIESKKIRLDYLLSTLELIKE